jgi:hypothetical protein
MSAPVSRHPMTMKRVLYDLPHTGDVTTRSGVAYSGADQDSKTIDIYYPPTFRAGERRPAVVLITGFSDVGAQAVLGCRTNEMESYISWGRLVAASGLIAVTHTTALDPASDVHELFAFLERQGPALGLDPERLAIWACSGHVPNALGILGARRNGLKCAVFCYGFMLDLDGATGVSEAQRTWRFANPVSGRSVADFPADVPLFVARAGRDAIPNVNDSIDRFLAHAVRHNLPITFVNHPAGPHAFDLEDDTFTTRRIVADILSFLGRQLRENTDDGGAPSERLL